MGISTNISSSLINKKTKNIMSCNCNQPTPCNPNPCTTDTTCECPTLTQSKCVTVESELECSSIPAGTILTEVLVQLDAFICQVRTDLINSFTLKNIGAGAKIYKGIDTLGRKELRTIESTTDLLTVEEATDTIALALDEDLLIDFIQDLLPTVPTHEGTNDGGGAEVLREVIDSVSNVVYSFRTLKSDDNSVTITQNPFTIDFSVNFPEIETVYVEAGENTTVTGTGTLVDPYVVNADMALLEDGVTTTVSGDGTLGNEYKVEVENLQKSIVSFPYNLLPTDDKHTLFVNNGSSDITINIPDIGMPDNFECVLIQKGTGTVTVISDVGVTLLYPPALTPVIKGRYYWVVLERDTTTQDYYLCGTLVPV